ncbi:MAG: transglutaminase-like domain-containing protein [Cyanobacteria bacterium REEB67]|nr:transglutaminase-like domain-containing protein [Cyanobacteria bacterium REEB67]
MRRSFIGNYFVAATLVVFALVAGQCAPPAHAAESLPRGVSTSNSKTYTVRQDTLVIVPAHGPRCNQVRVWHALPTHRPWSNVPAPAGAVDQRYQPAAIIEPEKDGRSAHIYWSTTAGLAPAKQFHYVSSFRVVSPERTFDVNSYRVSWSDVNGYNTINKIRFATPRSDIAELAGKLKYNLSPTETVVAYCKWIRENLSYDASVTYLGDDVSAILNNRRGHCMHFLTILDQLCAASGIVTRQVRGLNLESPVGRSAVVQSRSDYTNGHVWVEVYLPQVGWVEVEPTGGEKCFTIPATYIQNNSDFQNYAVWVTEDGQPTHVPKWTLQGKTYVNDYGIEHKITYSESRQ